MRKYHIQFLLSATDASQFPEASVPEIAFLGRSNVGKSSLINALLGSHHARVSSTPGRTRAINFFALHESATLAKPQIIFADLPGYGYAKISKSIYAEWPKFIDPYLTERPTLALCVCLVDMNIPAQESDIQLAQFLQSAGRKTLVVGTKSDRLSGNGLVKATRELKAGLGVETLLPCSAKSKRGMKELWAEMLAAAQVEA